MHFTISTRDDPAFEYDYSPLPRRTRSTPPSALSTSDSTFLNSRPASPTGFSTMQAIPHEASGSSRLAPFPAPSIGLQSASSITSLRTYSSLDSAVSTVPTSVHDSDYECDSEALPLYTTGVDDSHFLQVCPLSPTTAHSLTIYLILQLDGLPQGTTAVIIKKAFYAALHCFTAAEEGVAEERFLPVAGVYGGSLYEGSAVVAFHDTTDASSALHAVAQGTFELPGLRPTAHDQPLSLSCRLISAEELTEVSFRPRTLFVSNAIADLYFCSFSVLRVEQNSCFLSLDPSVSLVFMQPASMWLPTRPRSWLFSPRIGMFFCHVIVALTTARRLRRYGSFS